MASSVPVVISKDDMKKSIAAGGVTLIDVREQSEIDQGRIPGAKHAPLATLLTTLQDAAAFEKSFGFPRPALDSHVIFYCRSGMRAGKATDYARSVGFTHAQNYQGSFSEWAATETAIEK